MAKKLVHYSLWALVLLAIMVGFSYLRSIGEKNHLTLQSVYQISPGKSKGQPDPNRHKIIYVWATWCGVCKTNLPMMKFSYRHFNGLFNFEILTIAEGSGGKEKLANYIQTNQLEYPVYIATTSLEKWNIEAFPTILYLNSEGKLYFKDTGILNPIGVLARMFLVYLFA